VPYLNDLAHRAVSAPHGRIKSREDEYAHQRLARRNVWEVERNRAKALHEDRLVEEASIDQKIESKIKDPEVKRRLVNQIKKGRQVGASKKSVESDLSDSEILEQSDLRERAILALSYLSAEGLRSTSRENPFQGLTDERVKLFMEALSHWNGLEASQTRAKEEFNEAISELIDKKMVACNFTPRNRVRPEDHYHFTLTASGYTVNDAFMRSEKSRLGL